MNIFSGIGTVKSYFEISMDLTLSRFYNVGHDVLLAMLILRKNTAGIAWAKIMVTKQIYLTLSRSI